MPRLSVGKSSKPRTPPHHGDTKSKKQRRLAIYLSLLLVLSLVILPSMLFYGGADGEAISEEARRISEKREQIAALTNIAAKARQHTTSSSPLLSPPLGERRGEEEQRAHNGTRRIRPRQQTSPEPETSLNEQAVWRSDPGNERVSLTGSVDVEDDDGGERDAEDNEWEVRDDARRKSALGGAKGIREKEGNEQQEEEEDPNAVGDDAILAASMSHLSFEKDLAALSHLESLPQILLGQRDVGPVDENGNPLTNGAGVYFRHPFHGTCTTREAAPLVARPVGYDPRYHFVVIGMLSLDKEDHYELRMAQRDSWLTYKDVATAKNDFKGRVMVEYIIGLAFENNFKYSSDLWVEAVTHQDILGVNLREMKRKVKSVLTTGKYGKGPEVIMTFKTLAFYCYAEKTYTEAKFVIKADDDQFMRIPVLLRTALILPQKGVIWGTINRPKPSKKKPRRFCGTSGMLVGLSRDVVSLVNHFEPVQRFARVDPFDPVVPGLGKISLKWIYMNTGLYAEDVVAAQVLDSTRLLPETQYIHYYNEMPCRLHNHNADTKGRYVYFVNPFSMVIHHANRTEQLEYMKLFPETKLYDVRFPPTRYIRKCYGRVLYEVDICAHPDSEVHL